MKDEARYWSQTGHPVGRKASRKLLNRKDKEALLGNLSTTLRDFRARPELLDDVAMDLYVSLNTPVALSCAILLRYGEREQLARKSISPASYAEPSEFTDDYQAVSFLKKAPVKIDGVCPESAAREKFLEAEVACKQTNSRIRSFISSPEKVPGPTRRVISTAMGKILNVIGNVVDCREWDYACRFGPGSFNHLGVKGLTSLYDKLQVRPSVSPDMADLGACLVQSRLPWARSVTDTELRALALSSCV